MFQKEEEANLAAQKALEALAAAAEVKSDRFRVFFFFFFVFIGLETSLG